MTPSELVQKVCESVAISGVITMTTGRVGSKDLRDIAESHAALQREHAALREAARDYIVALDDAVAHCVMVKSDHNDDGYEPYDRALTQAEAALRAAALAPSTAPGEGA